MNTLVKNAAVTRDLNNKIRAAKAVLLDLQQTLEDFEDRIDLAKAVAENAGKPLIPWEVAAKELGIRPPPKKRKKS